AGGGAEPGRGRGGAGGRDRRPAGVVGAGGAAGAVGDRQVEVGRQGRAREGGVHGGHHARRLQRRLRLRHRHPPAAASQYAGGAGHEDRPDHQRLTPMLPLDACAGRGDAGGKAETLARMRAAGLRVADGVVVLPGEAINAGALAAALARLGGERFAVRSSATVEDAATGSAAGLFQSVVGVCAADVATAIAEVRASADAPAVAAYLQARGIARARVAVAVLIQPVVAAEERAPGEPEWGDVRARTVARDDGGALAAGMRALEAIVGGPVDAELARTGDAITWLQARPLVAATQAAHGTPVLREPGRWRLDAEHNPDPLSAAQAALVAFADGLGVGAPLRVVDRYLYVRQDAPPRV